MRTQRKTVVLAVTLAALGLASMACGRNAPGLERGPRFTRVELQQGVPPAELQTEGIQAERVRYFFLDEDEMDNSPDIAFGKGELDADGLRSFDSLYAFDFFSCEFAPGVTIEGNSQTVDVTIREPDWPKDPSADGQCEAYLETAYVGITWIDEVPDEIRWNVIRTDRSR